MSSYFDSHNIGVRQRRRDRPIELQQTSPTGDRRSLRRQLQLVSLHWFSVGRLLDSIVLMISFLLILRLRPGTSKGDRVCFSGWRMNLCPSLFRILTAPSLRARSNSDASRCLASEKVYSFILRHLNNADTRFSRRMKHGSVQRNKLASFRLCTGDHICVISVEVVLGSDCQ